MDLARIPFQNPAVLSRKIFDGEMVLVNADNAASLALTNETAVAVWELTNGKNSIQDIINAIHNSFKGVPETVNDDILAFIETLSQDGFIGFELERHTL